MLEYEPVLRESKFCSWKFRTILKMVHVTGRPLLLACLFLTLALLGQQVQCERAKALKRDAKRGVNYARFVAYEFHHLNVSQVGSAQVTKLKECGLACVNIVSCFSFNVAASSDIDGKRWCELLATDKYNSSDKFQTNQFFHHYGIYVSIFFLFFLFFSFLFFFF